MNTKLITAIIAGNAICGLTYYACHSNLHSKLYERFFKKDTDDLYNEACSEKDEKTAFMLFEADWEENKNKHSLNELAKCYEFGKGVEIDKKKAFELTKYNWDENSHLPSLHRLMYYYSASVGTEINMKKVGELQDILNCLPM